MIISYLRRFRDLIHGFVYLTPGECGVVDHPLFQRLRHIRQNDVAFLVYPSLNTTRFEHSLGCAHLAGRIATTLVSGREAPRYFKKLRKTHFADVPHQQIGEVFIRICRLYALLHDVGHLPLSHLFETAIEDYAIGRLPTSQEPLEELCRMWFQSGGFKRPHEAFGALVARNILQDRSVRRHHDTDNRVERTVRRAVKKGKPFWQKIGVAFPNSDGSLNVLLNCIPLDGRLHIRDAKKTETEATPPK